jgi:hypothetical protein
MSILYIYAIMLPVFAVYLTRAAFRHIDQPVPGFLAAMFWFIAGMETTYIKFVGNFGADTTYTALGNPEIGQIFTLAGVIMATQALLISIMKAAKVGWINGKK